MTISRREVPSAASELETLDALLQYCQETLLLKIDGLDDEALRRSLVPSGITLLGLVKHLAYVHRWWFRIVFAGETVAVPWTDDDPDADWRVEPDETTAAIVALYQEEVAHARAIIQAAKPDDPARNSRKGHTLRRLLVHMIQEISRHNGHADILRELIDGTVGD
jgi:uncharacterized damage-inducible protein DinB